MEASDMRKHFLRSRAQKDEDDTWQPKKNAVRRTPKDNLTHKKQLSHRIQTSIPSKQIVQGFREVCFQIGC